jgi:hypothetical protein
VEVHFVFQANGKCQSCESWNSICQLTRLPDSSLSVVGIPIEISTDDGTNPSFFDRILDRVDEVAAPGSVGETTGFTYHQSGFKTFLEESFVARYVPVSL